MPADRFLHPKLGHSEKVNLLTDLEFRVWCQYLLSADDFGVMRASAVTLQADNDHLGNRPQKVIARCLEALIKSGLINAFEHQKRRYAYQWDWQTWQKVDYPRATLNPPADAAALERCDDDTRRLFALHPGGKGKKFARAPRDVSDVPSGSPPESSEKSPTNARTHGREVANGYRQVANVSLEGGAGETDPPMDAWFQQLVARYPSHRRNSSLMAQQSFIDILTRDPTVHPAQAFSALMMRLDGQIRSHEWRVKGMAPRLDRYLSSGAHLQELDADPPAAEQLTSRTQRTAQAVAKIMGGES